jgi:Holliday junction resolvase RusA-like endonuclease
MTARARGTGTRQPRELPLTFTLPIDPPTTTAQMKRMAIVNGKPRFFHSRAMKAQVETWELFLAKHRPAQPLDGPLALSVAFFYAHTRESRRDGETTFKATRPDLDGVCKHFIDTMQGAGFFHDDGQIARLELEKWHAIAPRIQVTIDTL